MAGHDNHEDLASLRIWDAVRLPLAGFVALLSIAADGMAASCPQRPAGRFTVTAVVDAATLGLNDGSEVRLAGILPPAPPSGDVGADSDDWPPLRIAKAALERLVIGKSVALAERAPKKDRYGRLRTDVLLLGAAPPQSIAAQMLREGNARVYLFDKDRVCVDALLTAEAEARRAGIGLWQLEAYRARASSRPREIASLAGQLVIVEGRVLDVGDSHGRSYLNFGTRWREDLTVMIPRRLTTRFRKLGIDIAGLGGRRVRVRGFVAVDRGPLIRLSVFDHLEFIDPAPKLPQPNPQTSTGDGLIEVSSPPVAVDDLEGVDQ